MIDNNIIIQQLANKFANNYVMGKPIKIPSMKFRDWSILLVMTINNVKKLKGL
jgi:hypothetical protein